MVLLILATITEVKMTANFYFLLVERLGIFKVLIN